MVTFFPKSKFRLIGRARALAVALTTLVVMASCSTKPYTHYLIEPEVEVDPASEDGVKTPELSYQPQPTDQTVTMRWNDGRTYSQIDIPLSAATRIVMQNGKRVSDSKQPGPQMVLPAPTAGDTVHLKMHHAYLDKGLAVVESAPAVSLSQARVLLDQASQSQNYGRGLLITEAVLARYPAHPEFLKAQGSLFLLIGEKQKAIESYEKSLEVGDDPAVSRKLNELEHLY